MSKICFLLVGSLLATAFYSAISLDYSPSSQALITKHHSCLVISAAEESEDDDDERKFQEVQQIVLITNQLTSTVKDAKLINPIELVASPFLRFLFSTISTQAP